MGKAERQEAKKEREDCKKADAQKAAQKAKDDAACKHNVVYRHIMSKILHQQFNTEPSSVLNGSMPEEQKSVCK